jgi:hypothetical protein
MTDIQLPPGAPRREEMGGPGQPARQPTIGHSDLATLAGMAAVVFPLVYFASELVEVAQGNFTTGRLALTYLGEAGIVSLSSACTPCSGRASDAWDCTGRWLMPTRPCSSSAPWSTR